MENSNLSALDAYMNRVYRIIVIIIPVFCLCASTSITILHYVGWYPDINEAWMWAFDLSDVIYFAIGIYFLKTGFSEEGILYPHRLKVTKYTMAIILIIQWNGISYIWPFTDFWAYTNLFVMVMVFFFDVRLVAFSTVGFVASMLISWAIRPDMLLPYAGEYFYANMAFRFIGTVLMMFSLNVITYFGSHYLVGELEKHVNYDTLTHLLNRRSMDNYLNEAYRQASTGKTTFCLLMMDIDDFKRVNDTYGHDCGDEVLRSIAHIVSTGVKKDDSVFRWGGEEILVLLKTDLSRAEAAAERIRFDVAKDPIKYQEDIEVPVTITIGISPYVAGTTIKKMMEDADAKLYVGKHNGKNQVVSSLE